MKASFVPDDLKAGAGAAQSSLREQLRQSRRRSRVSTAAIALAEGALDMAALQHAKRGARIENAGKKVSKSKLTPENYLSEQRDVLEKENIELQAQIVRERLATAGTSVPFGTVSETTSNIRRQNGLKSPAGIHRPSPTGTERQLREGDRLSLSSTKSSASHSTESNLIVVEKDKQGILIGPGISPWKSNTIEYADAAETDKPPSARRVQRLFPQRKLVHKYTDRNTKNVSAEMASRQRKKKKSSNLQSLDQKVSQRISKTVKSVDPWEHFTKPARRRIHAVSKWRAKTSALHTQHPKPGRYGPELVLRLICAENMLALDRVTGTSDPVAFIFCGSQSYQSDVKRGTVSPYWNAEFRFGGKEQNICSVNELHVQIKDDDGPIKSEDKHRRVVSKKQSVTPSNRVYDNLGGVVIDLQQIRNTAYKWSKPRWYELKPLRGMINVQGRVRMSLRFYNMPDSKVSSTNSSNNVENNQGLTVDSLDCLLENASPGDNACPSPRHENSNPCIVSSSRRGKIVHDESVERGTESGTALLEENSEGEKLLRNVQVLSSFRLKAKAELKKMAKKIEKQAADLKQAQEMVKEAKKDATAKQSQCEERSAKIAELAHTIEMLQVQHDKQNNFSEESNAPHANIAPSSLHPQQKAPTLSPPPPPSHTTGNVLHRFNGASFEGEEDFSANVTQAVHRLRDTSTRSLAREELQNIADSLTSAKCRILWRCLRLAESDTDVNFQRECASIFTTFARKAPRACAGTLAVALDSLCRRILAHNNDSQKNNAIVQAAGAFSLHVLPIVLAGKVQPSFMPMLSPFFDIIRRYPHAQAGAVATQCVGEILSPARPQVPVERFQIFGVNPNHTESVLRKMLLSSVPTLPCPTKVSINPHEQILNIDVPIEDASRFYTELLRNMHYLPDNWKVAASCVHAESNPNDRRRRRAKNKQKRYAVKKVGELNDRHMHLVAACSRELMHSSAPLMQLFGKSEGSVRVSFFDTFGKLCLVASNGLLSQENRIARSIVAAGSEILQQSLDTLILENKSFIWKQRRAALQCIRRLAALDEQIHKASKKRVMRRSLPSVFDASVDMKVIIDAVKFAKYDKVNVVRAAAQSALHGISRLSKIKNGDFESFCNEESLSMKTDISVETTISKTDEEEVNDEKAGSSKNIANPKQYEYRSIEPQQIEKMDSASVTSYSSRHNMKSSIQHIHSSVDEKSVKVAEPSTCRIEDNFSQSSLLSEKSTEAETDNDKQEAGDFSRGGVTNCHTSPENQDSYLQGLAVENTFERLFGKLSSSEEKDLTFCFDDFSLRGAEALYNVVNESLSVSDDSKVPFMRYLMVKLIDDGNMVARAFGLLTREFAKRLLALIAGTLDLFLSSNFNEEIDLALSRILRWIYAAINSNHWRALEIVQGVDAWRAIRDAVQRMSSKNSKFSRKIHAAKVFALLRSLVLLEAHLAIFAIPRDTDSECVSDEDFELKYESNDNIPSDW